MKNSQAETKTNTVAAKADDILKLSKSGKSTYITIGMVMLILAGMGYYALRYLSQRDYYIERNFRQMHAAAQQIQSRINSYNLVLANATNYSSVTQAGGAVDSLQQKLAVLREKVSFAKYDIPLLKNYRPAELRSVLDTNTGKLENELNTLRRLQQQLQRHIEQPQPRSYPMEQRSFDKKAGLRAREQKQHEQPVREIIAAMQDYEIHLREQALARAELNITGALRVVEHMQLLHYTTVDRSHMDTLAKLYKLHSGTERSLTILNHNGGERPEPRLAYYGITPDSQYVRIDAQIKLAEIMEPYARNSVFATMCLVEPDSNVIYQFSREGGRITTLAGIRHYEEQTGKKLSSLWQAPELSVFDYSGEEYVAFSQPLEFDVYDAKTHKKLRWLLFAAVKEDTLSRDSREISFHVLLGFLLLLALLILAWPLLNIWAQGRRESIRAADVLFLLLAALLGSALISLVVFDIAGIGKLRWELEKQLEHFADTLATHYHGEIAAAYRQLVFFSNAVDTTLADPDAVQSLEITGKRRHPDSELVTPFRIKTTSPRGAELLHYQATDSAAPRAGNDWHYPWFDRVFWIDAGGNIRLSLNTGPYTTPNINVAARDYFQQARENELWHGHYEGKDTSFEYRYYLSPHYSWTSGVYESTLSIIHPGRSNWIAAMDISRMLSTSPQVLPPGFDFAIIGKSGQVLYHSRAERNWFENFFDECDGNGYLRSAVIGNKSGNMHGRYWGKDYYLYTKPLHGTPWHIITMHESSRLRTLNVLTLSLSGFSFTLLASCIFVLIIMAFLFSRRGREWIWPDFRQEHTYTRIAALLLSLLLGFILCCIQTENMRQILLTVLVLPFYALMVFYISLKQRPARISIHAALALGLLCTCNLVIIINAFAFGTWQRILLDSYNYFTLLLCFTTVLTLLHYHKNRREVDAWQRRHPVGTRYKQRYVLATNVLLLLVSVVPMCGLYSIAFSAAFEVHVQNTQRAIAESMVQRTENIRDVYGNYQIGEKNMFYQERLANTLDVSIGFFYNTRRPDTNLLRSFGARPYRPVGNGFVAELFRFVPLYSTTVVNLYASLPTAGSDTLRLWKKHRDSLAYLVNKENGKVDFSLYSNLAPPELNAPAFARQNPLLFLLHTIALLAMLALFYFLTRLVASKVLLIDIGEVTRLRTEGLTARDFDFTVHGHCRYLVILPPLMPPMEALDTSLRNNIEHYILDTGLYRLSDTGRQEVDVSAVGSNAIILLEGFALHTDEPETDRKTFDILAELMCLGSRRIVLTFYRDPVAVLYYHNTAKRDSADAPPAGDSENNRALRILLQFHKLHIPLFIPESSFAEKLRQKLKNAGVSSKFPTELLITECAANSVLRRIALEIADDSARHKYSAHEEPNEQQAIELLCYQAFPYYKALWDSCTIDEKLALADLTKDGVVNSKNGDAVATLLWKGLLRREPNFRPFNRSFEKFLLMNQQQTEVAVYELKAERSLWSSIRTPLGLALVLLLVFLFSTQPTLLDNTTTILSAITVLLPVLLRAFNILRPGKDPAE